MPRQAGDDVADPTPRVEAAVQKLKLRLARFEGEEAEGGAQQTPARV
jgi:hypothetical protein